MTCVHTFKQMWMQWPRWSQPVALFPSTLHFILWKPRAPGTSDKSGHESSGPKEERFAWYELRMNLSANMDSHPWLTEDLNFTNNEFRGHWLTGAPYVFWTPGRTNLRLSSQFPSLCPTCLSYIIWVNHCRKTLVLFFYQGCDLPGSISITGIVSSLESVPTNQNGTIWKPHLHNIGNFHYKKHTSVCLSGTQVRLLPESLSPGLQLLLLK